VSGPIPPNPPSVRGPDAAAAQMPAANYQSLAPQIVRQTPVQQIVTPPSMSKGGATRTTPRTSIVPQETGNGTKHQVGWVEERKQTAIPDRTSLTQMLLQIVSDRTGYPAEMLGLDLDLEAELGIDSIKRVEILGALGKNLPEGLAGNGSDKGCIPDLQR